MYMYNVGGDRGQSWGTAFTAHVTLLMERSLTVKKFERMKQRLAERFDNGLGKKRGDSFDRNRRDIIMIS